MRDWPIPNAWDMVALALVLGVIVVLGWTAHSMGSSYHMDQSLPISLEASYLPYYALRSVLRMFIALGCALLFAFIVGTLAAKSRQAERLIIPLIDMMQSVPVLGFLSISVMVFMALFPGNLLGPECAAIFAIFTAQVWNITLSFYQSLKTVPEDLKEAAAIFQLSAWQRFWRLEVPFAMPGLLWNTMMSMSASWVFLVASEAISVANHTITLPGLGSYIHLATLEANGSAIAHVIVTMFIVIAIYDQLLFRPLVAWVEKFQAQESMQEIESESWMLDLFQRTAFFLRMGQFFKIVGDRWVNFPLFRKNRRRLAVQINSFLHQFSMVAWNIIIVAAVVLAVYLIFKFVVQFVTWDEVRYTLYVGLITAIRVLILIALSSLVWVPVGVWIGLHPKWSQAIQPIIQFLAAFPANLLFPIVAFFIVRYHLNVNIWTSPLMILGAQWYILFNVIAGATALPKNLKQAASTLNVTGWLWWKRLALPGIFPYYITGAITAAGGAWNMSIVAEVVDWGQVHLHATGLGAYIARVFNQGEFHQLALGIIVMSLYVLVINRFVWRPLYKLAEERFRL
ncbi:MAG TPA: ABC transporter permease subunit [Coxiellaceae bacterium]|nr:ABC transporter permease subunit [Coxiellaceae bacterium]